MPIFPDDWAPVFSLESPLLALLARGTLLYFGILVLMRFLPRRTGGELATMDLVLVLLISEAASNSFGEFTSILDGLVLVIILMGWNFIVNVASYRFRLIERLVSSPPTRVVRDGEMLRRNMRREYLTEEELMSSLRQQGIDDIRQVKAAFIEGEGNISVIRNVSPS